MEHFIDIFTCPGSTGRSEISHSNRAATFKACRNNCSASVFFNLLLTQDLFHHPFFMSSNSSFCGHSRNPLVSYFIYRFSCKQKYIRHSPKTWSEPKCRTKNCSREPESIARIFLAPEARFTSRTVMHSSVQSFQMELKMSWTTHGLNFLFERNSTNENNVNLMSAFFKHISTNK